MATRGRPPKAKTQAVAPTTNAYQARYDAAGTGRRVRGWTPPASGPNKAIVGLQNIRNRSRDAIRNDWSGESGVQKWKTNLVGIGITPRFKRFKDEDRKQEVIDLWSDFVKDADADCVLNLYGMQTMVVGAWVASGEVFARKRPRGPNEGLAVPLQVQLIEADYVPMLDADAWPGLPQGNRIRSGIELNRIGKRVAYWLWRQHPGDGMMETAINPQELLRIPASEILHIFEPTRPGQLRGVPPMASVLTRLRGINDFDDAVLERQKLANLFVTFLTRTMPAPFEDYDIDPMTGQPLQFDAATSEPMAGLTPGMQVELDPGQDVKFSNPPEAGTTYSDYMRTQHMGTAAAAGIPYEVFSGDIRNVSDRTLRVLINEFRRLCEQRQWQIIIPMFCQPVVEWFADAAALAGLASLEEVAMIRRCEHSPHGWAYIHPVQDAQGKQIEVDAGFRSRSSVIAERGDDPDLVDRERAADMERAEALGLPDLSLAPATVTENDPEQQQQTADNQQQKKALNDALIRRADAEADAFRAQAERLRREPEPQVDEADSPIVARALALLGVSDEPDN